MDKINSWLSKTLRTKGNDIFRMKGVIAVKGWKEKFVFHGVHMMVRTTFLGCFLTDVSTAYTNDRTSSSRAPSSASGARGRRGRTGWCSSAGTSTGRTSGIPSRPASKRTSAPSSQIPPPF
jgi:hypothetical protein